MIASLTNRPRTGDAVAIAEVCHVCHRSLLGPPVGGAWTLACARCRRIDRRLGEMHGLTRCTPLSGACPGAARPDPNTTPIRRLAPERALGALRCHHARRTLAMAALQGSAAALEVPGDDVDEARIVDWRAWQATFPATDDAVAAGYRDYVLTVHPWVDVLEPRVADVPWLVTLLAA